MGFADSFNNLKSMFLSYDDEYDDMVGQPQQEVNPQVMQQPVAQKNMSNQYYEEDAGNIPITQHTQPIQQRRPQTSNVVPMTNSGMRSQATQMFLAKPTKFEEASEIGDQIKEQRTVFVNLEDASYDVSKRLLDFLSGISFAYDGKVDKVGKLSYIFAPHDTELIGENFESNKMDELETPGIYY